METPTTERETLILSLAAYVERFALIVKRRVAHAELDDLRADGWLGAIRSVDSYDPRFGVPIEPYASRTILGAILNGCRARDSVGERPRTIMRRARAAVEQLAQELGGLPTSAEIETRVPGYQQATASVALQSPLSADASGRSSDPENPKAPSISSRISAGEDPSDVVVRYETKATIHSAVTRLRPRLRRVIERHYFDDVSLREISSELDLSAQRVSQLHLTALAELRAELQRAS